MMNCINLKSVKRESKSINKSLKLNPKLSKECKNVLNILKQKVFLPRLKR